VLDEVEIAAELQHRVLADGMVRGEEGAKLQTWHEQVSRLMMIGRRCEADRTVTEIGPFLHPNLTIARRGWAYCVVVGALDTWASPAEHPGQQADNHSI
jgi:hypothetical protein